MSSLSPRVIAVLFTLTIFTSASLLFFIQPMYAQMVLPHLGGSSAVWTTAMLFFQTCLIVGYVYAHFLSKLPNLRLQMFLHLLFWGTGLLFLPIALPEGFEYAVDGSAQWQTLVLFGLGVGLPFTALSANAPLIQSWYARSRGPSSDDPYFLYAASNAGSLISLMAFPLIAQPLLGSTQISLLWAIGYVTLGVGLCVCGLLGYSAMKPVATSSGPAKRIPNIASIALWIGLAFIPSSLMLATTSFITTDIGSFPLIWVIPLALYLLTFVIAFESRIPLPSAIITTACFLSLVTFVVVIALRGPITLGWGVVGLLITAFFIIALFAHKRLFDARPEAASLTTFYISMSVGGALGGLFNSILAPLFFNDVYELAITVALAALLLRGKWNIGRDIVGGLLIPGVIIIAVLLKTMTDFGAGTVQIIQAIIVLGAIMILLTMWRQPLRFMIASVAIFAMSQATYNWSTVHSERSFFGVLKVTDDTVNGLRHLQHGTTIHGVQLISELGGQPRPLSYYYSGGPMGQIVTTPAFVDGGNIGVVGLGAGALACYRKPDQTWRFYEIDAAVDRIARDPALFSYMSSCAADIPTQLGDARIVLANESDMDLFDVLIIDAYSSDTIPVHLMTEEAFELYISRLAADGVLVLHISNRYFELAPVIERVASKLGLYSYINYHHPDDLGVGEYGSDVVAISRVDISENLSDGWDAIIPENGRIWTDDYSNLLGALQ